MQLLCLTVVQQADSLAHSEFIAIQAANHIDLSLGPSVIGFVTENSLHSNLPYIAVDLEIHTSNGF